MPNVKVLKQILTEPRFHASGKLPSPTPYLVSGTTFRYYIVPNLKEQFLLSIYLASDLFCQVGRAKQHFLESSSLTMKTIL